MSTKMTKRIPASLSKAENKKLKTNRKIVKERIRAYLLSLFEDYKEDITPLEAMRSQVEICRRDILPTYPAWRRAYVGTYEGARHMMEGGQGACYWSQAVECLKEWLEQSDAEAEKYQPERSWELYIHLCARECVSLLENNQKGE